MATGKRSKQVPKNLKKQLALAVRNIQWNYAIFWSISAENPGVLTWGDGYYNGDVKTRKTVQTAELNADQLGLQRSDQLRELFESLSAGETNQQAQRPTAALSPEDLTDAEWYFLVCMSFAFSIGKGLPGKTFAENRTIWLCNAHLADTKVFSRSLLSKSACIRTVACFPHLGGVIELGATDLVDKVSILDHTIEYLKELERKVEELESYKEVMEQESRTKSKSHDAIEQTSDNYGQNGICNGKKPLTNKRKACDIDKVGLVKNRIKLRDSSTDDIIVRVVGKDVIIEIRCYWKECVLLEVMEALSKLHFHPQSVQTSNSDGVLSMTIKAESNGLKLASAVVIRQAIQKVVKKC